MKLIVQITLGVFLGSLTAQMAVDRWREFNRQQAHENAQQRLFDREKARLEQADRVRALFLQKRKDKGSGEKNSPMEFVPDDALTQPPLK